MDENLHKYPHPFVTVDIVLFSIINNKLAICLSKRDTEPWKNCFSLPGTFIHEDESAETAVYRLLFEKLNINTNINIHQLHTFSEICRDPRERVISISYYGIVPENEINLPEWAEWFEVEKVSDSNYYRFLSQNQKLFGEDLAFDHNKIIQVAIKKLKDNIKNLYSFKIFDFLPDKKSFTASALQNIVKTVLPEESDEILNRGNFKKYVLDKYEAMNCIEKIGKLKVKSKGRPKDLYCLKKIL